jgi:hypothetical protein
LTGRALTMLRAGLALNIIGSLLKGVRTFARFGSALLNDDELGKTWY